ncbi:sensor histidine kinase [Candidatus Enterococcus clewellii]|uniref:histidine kinase n=1 Tax=Candidatus Enterococcus clewellii TaxID=1834193 RepID=A0A242K6L8_9ENTE|nr:HAMP domain-containing sensor histidine kinase [Enterococcus sp. 9E7_DIV0242]OTP15961.1 hypothetical protein A5888_002175 [Enterococcus sp. 9E7_DIV0242]
MGKRRSKTLTGAFFLLLLATLFALFWSYQELSKQTMIDSQQTLGALSFANELDEAAIVDGFESELDPQNVAEGQRLEEKYGYSFKKTRQQQNLQKFLLRAGLILVVSFFLLLLIWCIFEKRQKELQSKLLNIADRFEEEQRRNAVLLERRKSEEENVKSVITDITHQLKTPIASLKMSLEIAGSDNFSTEERKTFLEQGNNQIDKLDLMLDSLVRLSHLEAELISLKAEAFSLQDMVAQIVGGLIMKALDKRMEIEVEIVEDHLIFADRKWMIEAISNILENAIKYAPKQTTITIRGSILPSYALIEVLDEGEGIPPEEINLIYRRFYRGKRATVLENEGSGVGLYLARKIIEEQGGVLLVKNRQPQGANFQVTVPLKRNEDLGNM